MYNVCRMHTFNHGFLFFFSSFPFSVRRHITPTIYWRQHDENLIYYHSFDRTPLSTQIALKWIIGSNFARPEWDTANENVDAWHGVVAFYCPESWAFSLQTGVKNVRKCEKIAKTYDSHCAQSKAYQANIVLSIGCFML